MGVVYQSLQVYKALSENAPERAREKLAVAEDTARIALDQTRNLAIELRRSVSEETENGVATALRTLIETSVPDGVDAELSFFGDESLLPHDVGAQVYLIMREAIRNALRHSGCEELQASLEVHPGDLVGTVSDDGEGFDPDAIPDAGGDRARFYARAGRDDGRGAKADLETRRRHDDGDKSAPERSMSFRRSRCG